MSKNKNILILDLFSWSPSLTLNILEYYFEEPVNAKLITGQIKDDQKRESLAKFGAKILSEKNSGKFLKLLTLLLNLKLVVNECRKADKILLVWKTVLIYDCILFIIFGTKLYFIEHNVIEHDRKTISRNDQIRWYFAKNIVFMSNYSFVKFKKLMWRNKSNKLVLQHPLIDKAKISRSKSFIVRDRVCFIGSSRPYRGLQRFVQNIAIKTNVNIDVFTSVDVTTEKMCNRCENVNLSNGFLKSDDFEVVLQTYRFFVLPYLTSSQSGIFYSIIANDGVPIVTDTGDCAEKLREFGLDKLIFDLDEPSSFLTAVAFATENELEIYDKLQRLKTSVHLSFCDNMSVVLI